MAKARRQTPDARRTRGASPKATRAKRQAPAVPIRERLAAALPGGVYVSRDGAPEYVDHGCG